MPTTNARDIKKFAAELSQERARAGLSIRELAKRTGIPPGTLGGYFSARHIPPANRPEVLEAVLAACGVPRTARAWWHERLRDLHAGRRTPAVSSCPYRGLASYGADDADLFFGREAEQGRLSDVADHALAGDLPVVCVVGASASGKTSLVRAGLVADLASREPAWDATVVDLSGGERIALPAGTEAPQVLVLDQVEQLLVLDGGGGVPTETEDGLAALGPALDWAQEGPRGARLLVLVLRADVYAFASRDPRLRRALQDHQVVLSDVEGEQLRAVVEAPAHATGLDLEDGLTELVLADAGSGTGQALPHLSYLLARMWQRSNHRVLTVEDYRALGGFEGAIRVAAESAFEELTPSEQEHARRVVLTMVAFHPEVGPVRRPSPVGEADLGVLQHFVDRYLVTVSEVGAELSHEALLRSWPRLGAWIEQDRIRLTATGAVARAAAEWEAMGRDEEALLRGGRLQAALAYVDTERLSGSERAFLGASLDAARSAERREASRLRRSRQAAGALAVLAATSIALAANTVQARSDAEDAQRAAESRQVASYASALRGTDEPVSAYLAAAAVQRDDNRTTRSQVVAATGASAYARFDLALDPRAVATWAGGSGLALLGSSGELVMARNDPSGIREVDRIPPPGHADRDVFGLAASRDGGVLAVADGSRQLRVIDARTPSDARPRTTFVLPKEANDVDVTPEGDLLVASAGAAGVAAWVPTDVGWEQVRVEEEPRGEVLGVSVADDGSLFAAVTGEGRLTLWSRDEGRAVDPVTVQVGDLSLFAVDISPDRRRVAVAGADRTVSVFRIEDGGLHLEATRPDFTTWVNDVRFDEAGALLLAGSSNREIRAWEVTDDAVGAHPVHRLELPNEVLRMREGAHGQWFFIDNGVETYRWDVAGPRLPAHEGIVFISRFAREAPLMLTQAGRGDARTRLWRLDGSGDPEPLLDLRSPEGIGVPAGASDLSPDGRWILAGTTDGHALVWDVSDPSEPVLRMITRVGAELTGGASFSEDGTWAVAVSQTEVTVIDLSLGSPRVTARASIEDEVAAIDAGRDHLALSLQPRDVRLLHRGDLDTPVGTLSTDAQVWEARFGPGDQELYVAGADQMVHIVDVGDPAAPRITHTLTGPRSPINATDVSADGRRVAAAVMDGTTWVWRRRGETWEAELAVSLPTPQLMSVGWSPDSRRLATGGHDGLVSILTVDAQAATAQICGSRGDPLTEEEWAVSVPDLAFQQPCPSTSP